jgi:hypothetical protein
MLLLLSCQLPAVAAADGWAFGGHLKYQYGVTDYRADDLGALFGDDPARDQSFDGRLKAEWRKEGFDFSVHYEALALAGSGVETRRALNTYGLLTAGTASGLPNDRRRLFDLTHVLVNESEVAAVHRLDRLAVGYGNGTWLMRFGRQAVSWGNGLAFQVLDFMNPFSPLAIDKDYKPGDDLLYMQWQGAAQQDVQAMIVPRRELGTHAITSRESSYAAKWRLRGGGFDIDLMAARHYDENLLGVGLVRSIGGAVWRFDLAHSQIEGADNAWSLVTNLDTSWVLFGKNMYGFVEYFRSGVGETHASQYLTPNAALAARLARGELYTLARDYAALGLQVEFTPLVNGFASLLQNLNDGSRMWQLRAVYDWRQDTQLMAGVNLPDGERGSEYGGVAVPNPLPPPALGYLAPGRTVYIRVAYYF